MGTLMFVDFSSLQLLSLFQKITYNPIEPDSVAERTQEIIASLRELGLEETLMDEAEETLNSYILCLIGAISWYLNQIGLY